MSALTLTLRAAPQGRVDMSGILPATLAGLSVAEIASLPLIMDGRPVALGELFDVVPGEANRLVICTDTNCLDYLGKSMTAGTIIVEGPAGHYTGQNLRGGELVIRGHAGHFAASGMKGGLLRIVGNTGDWLGAALIGDRAGMAGGVVAVEGDVGSRVGDRMRRGLILVRGRAGDACATRLLAGTLVIAGGCGDQPGFGLRRGSLILGRALATLPTTFNDAGVVDLPYLGLLRRHADGILPGVVPVLSRVRRYVGDLAYGGKGEILVAI